MGGPECELVPVIGTIVVVGPVELGNDDTTYRYLVIREKGGALRDFTMVRAVPALSELIERDAIGLFLFWDSPAECRLCFVYRADGPKRVDFEAMRAYLEQESQNVTRANRVRSKRPDKQNRNSD